MKAGKGFMSASEIKEKIIEKLYNNNGIDYILINKAVGNFKPIIDWIVGCMVVITIAVLLIIVALEISYLMSPGIKTYFNTRVMNTKGADKSKLELILKDAIASYEEYITNNKETNLLLIYIKRKIVVIFIYGICLSLVLGYGGDLARIILAVFEKSILKILEYFG